MNFRQPNRKAYPRNWMGRNCMGDKRVNDAPSPIYYKTGETNQAPILSVTHHFLQIVQNFDPICRHSVLVLPLCKYYKEQVSRQIHNWSALLLGNPLDVPRSTITNLDCNQQRNLHNSLTRALFEIEKCNDKHGIDEHGIDKLGHILETYSDFKAVQKSVMSALCKLLEDEAIREKTQSSTLPGILFSIMEKMDHEEGITVKAIFTVILLFRPSGSSEEFVLKSERSTLGFHGIPTVLRFMHTHAHNPRIQEMSCWALINIGICAPHKEALLKAGVVALLVEIMNRHEKNLKVQYRALFALVNLVNIGVRHESTLALISSEEIMDRVMKSTSTFLAFRNIAERGCMVLYNLSLDKRNHSYLCKLGAVDLIRKAIQMYPRDTVFMSIFNSNNVRLMTLEDHGHSLSRWVI